MWCPAEDARRNVSITRATFNDTDKVKVVDLLKGRFRDAAGQSAAIATMTARLAEEVRTRGDRRIENADTVAKDFFARVTLDGVAAASTVVAEGARGCE